MDKRIEHAMRFIDANLNKDLTLKKVTQRFNLSHIYFSHIFKKEVKISFSKYLIQIRIKKAKEFLKEGSLSVKEISYKVGYKHISNFNHDFKKQIGLSPLEYKRCHQKIILFKLMQLVIRILKFVKPVIIFANLVIKYTKIILRISKYKLLKV